MSNEILQKQDIGENDVASPRLVGLGPKPLLHWRVYKYEPLEKMPLMRIFGASGILTLIALILLFQGNYFGVATFIAAAVVMTLFLTRKPPIFSCAIFSDSIVFQNQRHFFTDLDGFAMVVGRLIIFPKNNGATIHIPIDPEDSDEIHNFLAGHLEPREYEPTLLDVLEEFLRI
jgi:hypothetical protein